MSVINKMLRDLDAGQPSGTVAKPSLFSGLSAIRDTISVGDAEKNDRYVYTDRLKPFLLIALMLVAVLLALWYLMGFSNVGKPVSFKLLEPFQAQTQSPAVAPVPVPTPTPPSAANSAPSAQPTLKPNPNPQAEPDPKPEQAGTVPQVVPQAAQPMITLPEPVSAMNSLNFARMLAEPPLPRAAPSAGKSPAAMADAPASTFPAAAKTEKRAVSEAASTKPAVAAAVPAKPPASAPFAPVPTPRMSGGNSARAAPERASASDSAAQAQKQAAVVQETLAQAQNLWNAGSKEAAMDLLREAVAAIERAKASGTLPLDSPALPSLVRELARMELAEGRASQVLDLLIRLEPLVSGQADLWAVRGNAAQRLGQHQQASNAYLTALKLRPNEPRWMLGAAVSLAAQGQMVAAAALTDKARMTGSVSPEVLNYMKQLGVPIR